MLFNSLPFLIFFPAVTLLYFAIPHKYRWMWLLAASYFFYMCWNPKYALLMLFSTVTTFVSGLLIERAGKNADPARAVRHKKWCVAGSFLVNLTILFLFKYFDFAIDSINGVLGALHLSLLNPKFDVVLPVGISFYTFQALGYTMDVYRGFPAERSLGKYALFVSFFPQLVAGPIERTGNLLPQFSETHTFDFERMKSGLILMGWGFFMKLVVADRAALLVNEIFNNYTGYRGVQLLLGGFVFWFQVYCDFGGYSNIAIGAAEVMGFRLTKNFNAPFFARSMKEFWQRWHISLSQWFRDYLYFPMGGSRKGKFRKSFNLMVLFLTSGLWHGASWNYVAWGGAHGLLQVIGDWLAPARKKAAEVLHIGKNNRLMPVLGLLLTLFLNSVVQTIFRAPNIGAAFSIVGSIFTDFRLSDVWNPATYAFGLARRQPGILAAAMALVLLVDWISLKRDVRTLIGKQHAVVRYVVYALILCAILVFGMYGPDVSAQDFIYFQF